MGLKDQDSDARAQRTSEILETLVTFDTTSRNSNLTLVEWVEDYLDRFGVPHERISDANGSKANVWATVGPAGVPGTILSGHTNVVWTDKHGRATRSG
jgi:acetylornithine deacetylase